MTNIFVSHSSADDELVTKLSAWLSSRGYDDHFVDHIHVEVGTSWDEALRRKASKADILILYVTQNWLASDECYAEYRSSFYGDRSVLPLLAEPPLTKQPLSAVNLGSVEQRRLRTLRGSVQDVPITSVPPNLDEAVRIEAAINRTVRAAVFARRQRHLRQLGFAALVLLVTLSVVAIAFPNFVRGNYEAWSVNRSFKLATVNGKQSFFDCADGNTVVEQRTLCPEMVQLPSAETYAIGHRDEVGLLSLEREDPRFKLASPIKPVKIEAFAISKHEITKEQWRACVISTRVLSLDEERCEERPYSASKAREPVESISYNDARIYVRWLNRRLSGTAEGPYRLPSEAEWEYAARGGIVPRTRYSWGERPGHRPPSPTWEICTHANVLNPGTPDHLGIQRRGIDCSKASETGETFDEFETLSPVGALRGNAFKLHDMVGNVAEWVEDCWYDNHRSRTDGDASARTGSTGCDRVIKGGSWVGVTDNLRPAARNRLASDARGFNIGMRVVRDLK